MHQKQKALGHLCERIVKVCDDLDCHEEEVIRDLLQRSLPFYEVPKAASMLTRLFEREHAAFLLPDGRILAFEYRSAPMLMRENEFLSFLIADAHQNLFDFPPEHRDDALEYYRTYLANRRKLPNRVGGI